MTHVGNAFTGWVIFREPRSTLSGASGLGTWLEKMDIAYTANGNGRRTTVSDYISREAAIRVIDELYVKRPLDSDRFVLTGVGARLEELPDADVRPVVRGKWIIHKPFDSGRHNCNECIECSVCGTWFGHDCYEISNFCPNCGADMREEDSNGTTD